MLVHRFGAWASRGLESVCRHKDTTITTILINGASRGLGLALATQYADGNNKVLACFAKKETLALRELASKPLVQLLPLDVSNEYSIAAAKDVIGSQPIDIVINNASVLGPMVQSADHVDPETWVALLRSNALGPLLLAQALKRNLIASRHKKLVTISSIYASTGTQWLNSSVAANRYAYRASLAALNNSMRALASDWAADGVLVGILHADWVRDRRLCADAVPPGLGDRARQIIRLISELSAATSGQFRNYLGADAPW